jgi:hypothetical protein
MHKVIAVNYATGTDKLIGQFTTLEEAEAFRPSSEQVQGYTHLELWPHNWIHTDRGFAPFSTLEL